MGSAAVLLMLAATAVVALGLIRLVIVTDLAARLERHRVERSIRRSAAVLLADIERFRR
jgi:hypothetical protein